MTDPVLEKCIKFMDDISNLEKCCNCNFEIKNGLILVDNPFNYSMVCMCAECASLPIFKLHGLMLKHNYINEFIDSEGFPCKFKILKKVSRILGG